MKLGYLMGRLKRLNFSAMMQNARAVAGLSGKWTGTVLADMVWCALRYGAGYMDYRIFEFYRLPGRLRKTYLTRAKNNELVRRLNDKKDWVYFDNKVLFNKTFAPYVRREWIDLAACSPEEFVAFLKGKEQVIVKPLDGMCGKGVQKLSAAELSGPDALASLRREQMGLAEEVVRQHDALQRLYPCALNTLRVITVVDGGAVRVLFAGLRIGNHGAVVDNVNAGGMSARVDLQTGIIQGPAQDKEAGLFETHPMTGEPIAGLEIPHFAKAVEMVQKAALTVPGIRYAGWDVAIGQEELQLIEGNQFPSNDLTQLPAQTPGGVGLLPVFAPYLA